ncbi:MAG: enoyl-CoA hydratase/isomerase family protein [Dehalococcoidia bacterium]
MAFQEIIFEREGGVATLTLNRPDKLNSITPLTSQEIVTALEEVEADDELKVLILTGAGRAFCSGADLTTVSTEAAAQKSRTLYLNPFDWLGQVFLRFRELSKPTIAAINGIVTGSGFSISLGCDLRIASEAATLSLIFVKRGLMAGCGATYHLPRLIGTAKALELMWTGDVIDAREAERIGLVNRVVPAEELMKQARELAEGIANGPSVAIELTKRAVYRGLEANNFIAHMGYEAWAQTTCLGTEDFEEGRRAFLEKRTPVFKGR